MHKTLVALALILSTSFATLSDVTLTASSPVSSATAGYTITGGANDKIGRIVADIGDFNNDGYKDYAVSGSSRTSPAVTNVYIILGSASGKSANLAIDSGTQANNWLTITLPTGSEVTALAGGDLNGDGTPDLAIGVGAGNRAYVVYGKATGTWATWTNPLAITGDTDLVENKGFTVKGAASSGLGSSIAIGDFADDTKADLVLGMTGWVSGTASNTEGAVCVVFGRANLAASAGASTSAGRGTTNVDCSTQALLNTVSAVNVYEGILITGGTTDKIGLAVAAGADMNGDGNEDIFVSSQLVANGYIVYGSANRAAATAIAAGTAIDLSGAIGTPNKWLVITLPVAASVTTAAFIGNFNADANGRTDLALGYPGYSNSKGRVYVLFGQAASLTSPLDLTAANLAATSAIHYTGKDTANAFGFSLDAADINNSGTPDLIVGAPLADDTVRGAAGATGKVYVIYGSASNTASTDLATTALTSTTGITITGLAQSGFGVSVSSAGGDLNADGVADFIVGAPLGTKDSVTATGVVYEFRGQKIDTPVTGSGATLSASLLVLASFFVALMF